VAIRLHRITQLVLNWIAWIVGLVPSVHVIQQLYIMLMRVPM
jgi:hypothetical protein